MKIILSVPTIVASLYFYGEGVYLGFAKAGLGQGLLHALVPVLAMQHGIGHTYGYWL